MRRSRIDEYLGGIQANKQRSKGLPQIDATAEYQGPVSALAQLYMQNSYISYYVCGGKLTVASEVTTRVGGRLILGLE